MITYNYMSYHVYVCRSVLLSVCQEEWFLRMDHMLDDDGAIGLHSLYQKRKPFTTHIRNENKELEKLTFDAQQFSREHRREVSQLN